MMTHRMVPTRPSRRTLYSSLGTLSLARQTFVYDPSINHRSLSLR